MNMATRPPIALEALRRGSDVDRGGEVRSRPLIELREVHKVYRTGAVEFEAVRGISADIREGEFVAVTGPSGSGKSTLMHIIGCLDVPTSGTYRLAGEDVGSMSETELAHVRNRRIGFVFQQYNLLPLIPAWRNVELPLTYAGVERSDRQLRAIDALDRMGIADCADQRPGELSGGQQQRVAIARAIVTNPDLILCDEPTGALDSQSAAGFLTLLTELHDAGRTVVLISHEPEVVAHAERVVELRDGRIVNTRTVGVTI